MGHAPEAVLAYGYNLGSPREGWNVEEAGFDGHLTTTWYSDIADNDDFVDLANKRIGGMANVHLVEVHVDESPVYLLATRVYRSRACEEVDPAELFHAPADHQWSALLTQALEALDLTPDERRPRWLLCTDGGGAS